MADLPIVVQDTGANGPIGTNTRGIHRAVDDIDAIDCPGSHAGTDPGMSTSDIGEYPGVCHLNAPNHAPARHLTGHHSGSPVGHNISMAKAQTVDGAVKFCHQTTALMIDGPAAPVVLAGERMAVIADGCPQLPGINIGALSIGAVQRVVRIIADVAQCGHVTDLYPATVRAVRSGVSHNKVGHGSQGNRCLGHVAWLLPWRGLLVLLLLCAQAPERLSGKAEIQHTGAGTARQ